VIWRCDEPLTVFAFDFNICHYIEAAQLKWPVKYEDSMNTVLHQAGGLLRTGTRPSFNLLLLRASV